MSLLAHIEKIVESKLQASGAEESGTISYDDHKKQMTALGLGISQELTDENSSLKSEVESLINYIDTSKAEMMSIQAKSLTDKNIPDASDQLDAIISTTEKAADDIMDAAENISEIAEKVEGEHSEALMEITSKLFEASSFQDICGQRITKVMTTLTHLEAKLKEMAEHFGSDSIVLEEEEDNTIKYDENGHAINPDKLLEGPQNEGEGNSQDDIDALFD